VGLQGEFRDDGELVAAAFEGPEEIWLGSSVGVGNGSVGEDDFEIGDVVTGEALINCR
jgi:hypothetical protein